MTEKKTNWLLAVLMLVLCVPARADLLSGIPTTNDMHGTTNYLVITSAGGLEWRVSPSNLVDVLNAVLSSKVVPPVNLLASAAVSVGGTTLSVHGLLPVALNAKTVVLQIDPYTANCETFVATSLSGQTFTLSRAARLAHSSGAKVLVVLDGRILASTYNAKGDAAVDDWMALQRAIIEVQEVGATLVGGLDFGTLAYRIKQPLFFAELKMRDMRMIAPIDFSTAANMNLEGVVTNVWAVLKTARNQFTFTVADHATDEIVLSVPAAMALNGADTDVLALGPTIAFSAPYGETLPAGISSGRLYKVKTLATNTGIMTISEIVTPGTTLNITGNGSGWGHPNHESNTRVKWDNVRLSLNATNLNGFYGNLQQQAYTEKFRIDMEYSGSNSIGAQIVGQGSFHNYLEIDPSTIGLDDPGNTNQVALLVGGGGGGIYHSFTFTTINGHGGVGVKVYGSSHVFQHTLLESLRHAGFQFQTNCSGVTIGNIRWTAITGTNVPCIDDKSGATASVDVGQIRTSGLDVLLVRDTTRDYIIRNRDGGAHSGNGDGDSSDVFPGYYQSWGYTAPVLKGRRVFADNNDHAMQHIDRGHVVDSSGADRIITLPFLTAGWRGLDCFVTKGASGNTVYVTNRVGNTINSGTPLLALTNLGQTFRFVADGSGWILQIP